MRFIVLAICLLVGPGVTVAQVTMEAHLGLQGTVRLEKWNPVTVSLYNPGASLTGTLGVRVWRGSEYRQDLHVTTFTRRVQLPHRSRKRFTFTVPITSISHPVEVFLRTADTVLAQQQLELRDALSAEHVIVGLTRDLSLDFLATAFQRHTRVAYLPLAELPYDWIGYDSVTAVVIKGMSFQAVSERQWTALRQWLIRGGTVVIVADAQYALLQEPRLQSVLPVEVSGLEQLDGLPVLAIHYGVPLPTAPLLAARARLQHGQILVGTPEAPLLAQRTYGKGRVVFLAVDYAAQPLASWQGNVALWKDILQPVERIDFSRVFAELGLLDEAHPVIKLLGRPILAYPSHVLLSGFLLAYCGSLALLFWWMRQRRAKRSRCWVYAVCIVFGFTVGAYSLFPEPALREPALFFDVSSMEIFADADYTHMHAYLGVFSARGGQFTLDVQHPTTVLRHTFHRGTGKAGEVLEMTSEEPLAIRGIHLAPWTLRVFSVETMTPAPLRIAAQPHRDGLTLRVHNQSPLAVQGMAVLYRGRLFSLGTLAAGEELFEELYTTLQPMESKYETAWQALLKLRPAAPLPGAAYFQEVLLQHYFGEKHLAEFSATPVLVGWMTVPSVLKPPRRGLPARGMTLVVSQLVH
jgi:hypothetical protein